MNILEKFHNIHTFIFDVDGVLTNSKLLITEDGQLLRQMNVRDGYAIKQALKAGYKVAIITGGRSEGVIKRLKGLGIEDIYSGIDNKMEAFRDFIYKHEVNTENILYMGDDMPDYEVLRLVELATCPVDAAIEIKHICTYISPIKGGEGCVRDVIEKTLRIQEKWLEEG